MLSFFKEFQYPYDIYQWLMLFYIYSFFGWVYESLYVSTKKRKWVNRGFMVGPMLPLYGSGAIVMLMLSMPFQDNLVLVYIAGCIGATALEYITGVCMEKLFKVRYWDYTGRKFNFQGHICLAATLLWGCFSVAMVRFINPPVAELVLGIKDHMMQGIVFVISLIAIADFTYSFKAALDLKALLERLEAGRSEVENLRSQLEQLVLRSRENTALQLEAFAAQLEQRKKERSEKTKESLSRLENRMENRLENLRQQLEELKNLENRGGMLHNEGTKKYWEELEEIKGRFAVFLEKRKDLRKQSSFGIRNLLKGNPDAVTKEDMSLLEELRNILENEKNKKNLGKKWQDRTI